MKKEYIDQLLQKYWDAESSIEEENTLKSYFNNNLIHTDHQRFKALFVFLNVEQSMLLDENFYPPLYLEDESKRSKVLNLWSNNRFVLGIAASFLILIVAIIGIRLNQQNGIDTADKNEYANIIITIDQEEELEEAYALTTEALAFLSGKMQIGQQQLSQNIKQVDKLNILNFE